MVQKTEVPGIYKVQDGILINKDSDALDAYKKKRIREHKIMTIQDEISELKNDISEIKSLLKGLVR
jgi:hypothetical protein